MPYQCRLRPGRLTVESGRACPEFIFVEQSKFSIGRIHRIGAPYSGAFYLQQVLVNSRLAPAFVFAYENTLLSSIRKKKTIFLHQPCFELTMH